MPAFVSPFVDPASWTYSIATVTVPNDPELRYRGYTVTALRGQRAAGGSVAMPAAGLVRRATGSDSREYVEIQTNPFPIRNVVSRLAGGVPVFYIVFADATGLSILDDQVAPDGEVLRAGVSEVTVAVIFQDRVTRDPALWASQIGAALSAASSASTSWTDFATAVTQAIGQGNSAPVFLLDHAGRPLTSGSVDLVFGSGGSETVRNVTLDPADLGNLQNTVTRLNPGDPGLWSGGVTSFRIRPARTSAEEFQLARLEDAATGINEIAVTPAQRHALATKVTSWFAPQYAVPTGQTSSPLARYSRGNLVTPLINGPEFFDDLFRRLQEARDPQGRFDLAGWAIFPQTEFTKARPGEPADLPVTLEQAAQRISAAGGSCRFLAAQFLQLEPGITSVTNPEVLGFYFLVGGILVLNQFGVSFVRTDPAGIVILLGLTFANAVIVSMLFSNGGETLEPNKDAVDVLNPIANIGSALAAYPAHIDDNTAIVSPLTDFPFTTLFQVTRRFGIYHQKFAIVRTPSAHIGYCGGIDPNPDRLDDANHLAKFPYHDLHVRVDGPAVADLAISFSERWAREGTGVGDTATFDPPAPSSLGTPGTDIVQVARTYFEPQASSRALPFAPQGDRTLADTMLAGIAQAREFIYIEDQYLTPPLAYRNALMAKVSSGDIRSLIIAVPGVTDQPFGALFRSQFVTDLKAAAPSGTTVRVGYPRRRYTVPENELRASSGRCTLGELLPASPGLNPTVVLQPAARIPSVPFWLAVEGELMWVYDEASGSVPPNSRRFAVLRGADTRLLKGPPAPAGASTRQHEAGVPATVVDLTGIYVHAKMMIVDDVFLCVGSANLNRRGLFHDGEINVFSLPAALRATPANPITALRRRLQAEMLDLPENAVGALLDDPVAAGKLFDRSWLSGNRFLDLDAFPSTLMLGATTGDALIGTLLQGFLFTIGTINMSRLYDGVVDPSSSVESG